MFVIMDSRFRGNDRKKGGWASMRRWSALIAIVFTGATALAAQSDREIERLIAREMPAILPADGIGGAAIARRVDGRTLFFNYGWADVAARRPIDSHSLFNIASLRKLFEVTLIAHAAERGELRLDDPVSTYVAELQEAGYMRRVTLRQLATYTSGLSLRQDYEPWPDWGYNLPEFIRMLAAWKPDDAREPGTEHHYTHAGYVLLQLALERRFAIPIGELLQKRVFEPVGLSSTLLPLRGADGRAQLPAALMARAVQGYGGNGEPIGAPGDQQTFYNFPGTGQMFSSARDLAEFLAAHLGERAASNPMHDAMQSTQVPVLPYAERNWQALAWEVNATFDPPVVEKNAGLNNMSGYIGMVPAKKLAIVILTNRGSQDAAALGRRILTELARR
jgi:beta-lactamase class C